MTPETGPQQNATAQDSDSQPGLHPSPTAKSFPPRVSLWQRLKDPLAVIGSVLVALGLGVTIGRGCRADEIALWKERLDACKEEYGRSRDAWTRQKAFLEESINKQLQPHINESMEQPRTTIDSGIGKGVPTSARQFDVLRSYSASGKMGDIGDVTIAGAEFSYITIGEGPHEYEWKYENDKRTLSSKPAQFGGVVWLSPANEFGTAVDGGYDLRGFRGIEWEARAVDDPMEVEFFIGGIDRVWHQDTDGRWEFVRAPYPDTMPRTGLGIRKLTKEWQTFRVSLSDRPEEAFARVVGGFGWVATWGNNGVQATESGMRPSAIKKLAFEVRNVFYVRETEK